MNADRNLLFGILALQMDFVARDALITAMHAWVLDKDKPLGLILLEHGALSNDTHELLQALVARHLAMHDNDAAKSLAALSSLESARQELAAIPDALVQQSLGHVAAESSQAHSQTLPLPSIGASGGEVTSKGRR